jgi:hypothetical protein
MSTEEEKFATGLYESVRTRIESSLIHLEKIIKNSGEELEGNCFYYHLTLTRFPSLYNKQVNLVWCGAQARKRIFEVGFNAGHSSMLLLSGATSNLIDNLEITISDYGSHRYTRPCLDYVQSLFPTVNFRYIEGDSRITLPLFLSNEGSTHIGTYDVVHIDGGHDDSCVYSDLSCGIALLKRGGILIIDDTNQQNIKNATNNLIQSGCFHLTNTLPTYGYEHIILIKTC